MPTRNLHARRADSTHTPARSQAHQNKDFETALSKLVTLGEQLGLWQEQLHKQMEDAAKPGEPEVRRRLARFHCAAAERVCALMAGAV